MTKIEVRNLLASCLQLEPSPFECPTEEDWRELEVRMRTSFAPEFRFFIDLLSEFAFPGDVYNVASGRTNGNDSVVAVYDSEVRFGGWPQELIPFYGIGNGDYFALSSLEGPGSRVYYYSHADRAAVPHSASFSAWLQALPDFLRGH